MVIEQSTQSRVIEEGMHMSSCIAHQFAGHNGYVMGDILLSMKKFDELYREIYRKKNLKLTVGLLEAIGFTKQVAQNGVVSYTTRIPGNEKYIKRFCASSDIEYAMKEK